MISERTEVAETHISMAFKPRGGKTVIVLPDGTRGVQRRGATIDNSMVKLLVRGFRWHRMLFSGNYTSIEDMSAAEKISPTYVCRVLRLAYLSPQIVEAILDGKVPAKFTMKDLMEPFPMDWNLQLKHFGFAL